MSASATLPVAPPAPPVAGSVPPTLPMPPGPPQPPAPPMEPVTDTAESPAEVEIIKKASGAPFKPPAGKLPPLPPPPPNAPFPPPPSSKSGGKIADKLYTKKVKKIALIAGGVVGLLAVIGGGFFAFQMFTKEDPPPPPRKSAPPAPKPEDQPAQTADAKPADAATTPEADKPVDAGAQPVATNDPAATPAAPQTALGQAVATTKETITKVEQGRTADANEVIASDAPAPKTDEPKPAVTTPEEKPAVAETKPVTPAPRPGQMAAVPSAAFKAWVADLKNVSVRAGSAPRVFIGGITYPQGEVVNPQLGIIFEGYDDKRKMIIFRDKSGARVERRR